MKIYTDHAKMEDHYCAVQRMKTRYNVLFIIMALVFIILGSVMLAQKDYYIGGGSLAFGVAFLVAGIIRIYKINIFPKKVLFYKNMLNMYSDNKIKSALVKRGLKLDNIDVVLDPNSGIKVGYVNDPYTYYEMDVLTDSFGFAFTICRQVLLCDAKVFDKYIKKSEYKNTRFKYTSVKGKTIDDAFDAYVEYINSSKEQIDELSKRVRTVMEESKKVK